MDAVDRYLREVKFWLPRNQRDDIIAELSEDLRSEIEERGSELERALTDDELSALLAERGSPLEVARQYAPTQHLIGPSLYPVYRQVLKWSLLLWLLPSLVIGLLLLIYDTVQPSDALQITWLGLLRFPLTVGAYGFAGITLLFAALEWRQRRAGGMIAMQAAAAEREASPLRLSRFESIAEAIAALLITLFWVQVLPFPTQVDESIRMAFGPTARLFYYPLLLCFLASGLMGLAKLRHTHWTPGLARLRLLVSGLHVVTFALILVAVGAGGRLVTLISNDAPAGKIVAGEKWLTVMWAGVIAGYLVGYVGTLIKDLRRVRKLTTPPAPPLQAVVVLLVTLLVAFAS
jgi:hypothetical protein